MAPKRRNLVGQTFGHWTVISEVAAKQPPHWLCRCTCGTERSVKGYSLTTGASVSCGQCSTKLEGHVFGRLTVISRAENIPLPSMPHGRVAFLCRCVCGEERTVSVTSLRSGETTSCGCYRRDYMKSRPSPLKTHGYRTNEQRSTLEGRRRAAVWGRFRLTPETYQQLLDVQNGVCAICQRPPDPILFVDHDHTCCGARMKTCGNCVRGLLCKHCNSAIGLMKDNVQTLQAAIDYLQRPTMTQVPRANR